MDPVQHSAALTRTLTDADIRAVEQALEAVLRRQDVPRQDPRPVDVPRPVERAGTPPRYVTEVAWHPPGSPLRDDRGPCDDDRRHCEEPERMRLPPGPRTLTDADLQAIVDAIIDGRPRSGFSRWGERAWSNVRTAHRSKTVQLAILNAVLCGAALISPEWMAQHRELAGIIVIGTNTLAVWLRLLVGQTINIPNQKIDLPQIPKK